MSRIQHILDKAEREGTVRRMHALPEPAAATIALDTPVAISQAAIPPLGAPDAAPSVSLLTDVPGAHVVGGAPSIRTARSNLDRLLVAALSPGASAEQYRALRARVAQSHHGGLIDVIVVTSPGRGEGKSFTAANLALTMGQDFQSRICLVDADLRHPRQHTLFGIAAEPGLAEVLAGQAPLHDALITLEDQPLTVLPAGQVPAHPTELLGSSAMRRMLETLRSQFDRVIIDAPSAAPLADVGILTTLVDSVVLVVQAGTTTKPAIQEAISTIGSSKVLGVVLNGVPAAA